MDITLAARDHRTVAVLVMLTAGLLAVTLFSLTVGAVSIPVQDVVIILLQHLGLFKEYEVDSTHAVVLETIRLPRIVMTVLIGGALGVSGAALQGLFRNPLVEPSLIGVSGGSAAAVVIVIVFGGWLVQTDSGWIYHSFLSLSAFSGGLIATFLVLKLSYHGGRTHIAVLVLIGVALNALTGAIIGLAIFYADENQLSTFTFWTLGDLGVATWEKLLFAGPVLLFAVFSLLIFSRPLNALALGEAEASHLGVNVERTKLAIILLSALCVGISVSLAGIVGFIGLVVPHIIRISFFPDNKLVLPASVAGGALMLVVADIVARTVVIPSELPIGVITALMGSPFFIGLLLSAKRKREL